MNLDLDILYWINGHHTAWLDSLMWTVSRAATWIPLYVLLVGLVIYRFRNWKQILMIFLAFGIAVGLSDYTCSGILKPLVCRLRPTHEPAIDPLHLVRGYTGGLYGFCSSHAANTMSVALLFCLLFKNKTATIGLMTWVAANSYSRVYLGAHYPSDILVGWLIGAWWSCLAFAALQRWVLPAEVPPSGSLREDDEAPQQGGS